MTKTLWCALYLFIAICHIPCGYSKDLLSLFRPKADLPQELNQFLADVQNHKKDFVFIRNALKNKRKYENSFQENHQLFGGDLVLNPDMSQISQVPFLKQDNFKIPQDDISKLSKIEAGLKTIKSGSFGGLQSYYPQERYSRFIHSPVRLKRKMEQNALDQEVQVNSNSLYGYIEHSGPKFPHNQYRNDKNRLSNNYADWTGDDSDDGNDENEYDESYAVQPMGKKKREVEISIKSDGKLIKQMVENENGPKSIILNIKTDQQPKQEAGNTDQNPQPISSSGSLDSSININNQNEAINPNFNFKDNTNNNFGVPINSLKNSDPRMESSSTENNRANPVDSNIHNINNFAMQETPKLQKLNNYYNNELSYDNEPNYQRHSKNEIQPQVYDSGILNMEQQNNIEKTIDVGQNMNNNFESNMGKVPSPDVDQLSDQNKKDDFEKVQGISIDNSITSSGKKINNNFGNQGYRQYRSNNKISNFESDGSFDYIGPLDNKEIFEESVHHPESKTRVHSNKDRSYKIIEVTTRRILVVPIPETTTECPLDIRVPPHKTLQENVIVNDDDNTTGKQDAESMDITDHPSTRPPHHCSGDSQDCRDNIINLAKKRKAKHSREAENEKIEKLHKSELRHKKHPPALPKFKRKHVRQHSKHKHPIHKSLMDSQNKANLDDLTDTNLVADGIHRAPSYKQRRLKAADYEYDPNLIHDVGDHEQEEIEKYKKSDLKNQFNSRSASNRGSQKKLKSEGSADDEEDPATPGPSLKIPIKKTMNQLALAAEVTTEDNDDDYNYQDLTDMDDENEDISYEEEELKDNVGVEEAITNTNRNELDNEFNKLITDVNVMTVGPMDFDTHNNVIQGFDDTVASAHSHGGGKQTVGKKKKKKKKPKTKRDVSLYERILRGSENHNNARRQRRRWERENTRSNKLERDDDLFAKFPYQSENDQMSNQEKEDLFLIYNPEFQRWPRFIDENRRYHEPMKKRAVLSKNNPFPVSNEFLLNPKLEFVKREEPSTEVSVDSESESTTLSPISTENADSTVATEESTSVQSTEESTSAQYTEESTSNQSTEEKPSVQSTEEISSSLSTDTILNQNTPSPSASNISTTELQFTTIEDDMTSHRCPNGFYHHSTYPCIDDKASHIPVTLTSVLPLLPESATHSRSNISKEDYLDLNDIVEGTLPKQVVSYSMASARGIVREGLRSTKYNTNIMLSSFNNSAETGMILNEMTNLMMKLKYHSTCQSLSPALLSYLKIITKNDMDDPMSKLKEMNEIDFDDHQSSYVFHASGGDNIQDKAEILKELLNKYNNLPKDCKERAEPVKEYIESHLAMIDRVKGGKHNPTPAGESEGNKVKKEISTDNKDEENKLENQVMEEGLQNPYPDANEVIEDQNKKIKRDAFDDRISHNNPEQFSRSTSIQYGKLAHAVSKMKREKEAIKRISDLYGKNKRQNPLEKRSPDKNDFESPPVINF